MTVPTIQGTADAAAMTDKDSPKAIFAGLAVVDPDAGENDLVLEIRLVPNMGTFSGTNFTWIDAGLGPSGSRVYRLTALTVAQANAALDDVKFAPATNSAAAGTFDAQFILSVDDDPLAAGGHGFYNSPTITVTRVNDAPTVSGGQGFPGPINSTEVTTINALILGYGDVDSGSQWGGVTIIALPSHGTLFRDADQDFVIDPGEEVAAGQFVNLQSADILRFKPDSHYGGSESFTYVVRDPQGLDAAAPATINFQIRSVPAISGAADTAALVDGESRLLFAGLTVTDYDLGENDFSAWIRVIEGVQGRVTSSSALYRWNPRGAPDQGFYYLEKLVGGAYVTSGITVDDINDALDFAMFTAADGGHWEVDNTVRFEVTVDDSPVTVTANTATIHGTQYASGELTIIAENDAPVNTIPGAQDMAQGATIVFNNANNNAISISDVDYGTGPGTNEALKVTISVADGVLTVTPDIGLDSITGNGTGTIVLTGNEFELNQTLQGLSYKPPAGVTGIRVISITTDDGGNYPPPAMQTTSEVTVRIGTVNGTPDITDLRFDTSHFTEDGPPVAFDVGTSALVSDDNANFGGGTLTAVFTNLANTASHASDQLVVVPGSDIFVRSRLTSPTTSVLEVVAGEVVIGTVTSNGLSGAPLTIALNGNATVARVQDLVRALGFNNPSDTPTPGSREVQITLTDGSGPNAKTIVIDPVIVGLTAQNGVPVLTSHTTPVSYTEAASAVGLMAGVTVTDEESSLGFEGGRVRITVAGGGANAGAVTLKAGSDFVVVGNELRLNEGPNQYLIGQIGGYGTTGILVSNLSGDVTLARLNNLLDEFVFSTTSASTRATGNYTITLQFNDGFNGGPAPGAPNVEITQTLAYSAINSAPSLDLDSAGAGTGVAAAYVENAGPIALSASPSFSDPESHLRGGKLTVEIASASAADRLTIMTDDVIQIYNGNQIYYYDLDLVGTFTGGTGTTPLVITLASSDGSFFTMDEMLAELMKRIGYSNLSDAPGASRQISFTLDDGDGGPTATATGIATVAITQDNDAPSAADTNSASLLDTQTHVFTVADFAAGMTDPEGNGLGAVQIVDLPEASRGIILYDADGSGSGSSPMPIAANDSFTRADLEQGRLSFVPAPTASAVAVTFSFKVTDDGAPPAMDDSAGSFTLNVDHANAAPVVDLNGSDGSGIDFASAYTEGGSAAAVADNDVLITDPDAGDGVAGATITIADAVAGDMLTVTGALPANIAIDPGSTATTLILTGAGTAAEYEAALKLVAFSSSSDNPTVNGSDVSRTITTLVNDGQTSSAAATTIVTLTATNDLPSGSSGAIAAVEETHRTLLLNEFGSDSDGSLAAVTITSVGGGKIYYDADGAGAAQSPQEEVLPKTYSAADFAQGRVSFLADPDVFGTGAGSITFVVRDDQGADAAASATLSVNVAGVNDQPFLQMSDTGPGANFTYVENAPAGVVAPTAVLTDDSPSFAGGSLLVYYDPGLSPAGSTAEDQLGIRDQGTGPGLIGFDGTSVTYSGIVIGTAAGGGAGTDLTVTLNSNATPEAVRALIRNITYRNLSEDASADLDRVLVFKVTDDEGAFSQGAVTISITPQDEAGVIANDDVAATPETAPVNIDVLANDTIVGAPPAPRVIEVAGQAIATGGSVSLASGATVTLNADGTLTYDPGAAFGWLTDSSSGAVNTSAVDSFQYREAQGDLAQVTVTISGVANSRDQLHGSSGDDKMAGTEGPDVFILTAGGDDDVDGLGGNDVFIFRATMTSADKVNGGGGRDQIAIQGNYTGGSALTLGTGVINVESLALVPGNDTRRGDPGTNFYSYNITTVNENVVAGDVMTVDGARLRAGENLTFSGAQETDGGFRIFGGLGTDLLTGGSQTDVFLFGPGAFGAGDTVNGGAGTARDQLALRGDYTIAFGSGQLTSIESMALLSGRDTAADTDYDYDLAVHNNNLAAGQSMTVDGAQLRTTEHLVFDGRAEQDGTFKIFGGAGDDTLYGGRGADQLRGRDGDDTLFGFIGGDTLTGGGGIDLFSYIFAADSATGPGIDKIIDFTAEDSIDLTLVDAVSSSFDTNEAFTFIGSAAFSGVEGQLRIYENAAQPGNWFVEGDVDGDGAADLVIEVTVADLHTLGATDFIL